MITPEVSIPDTTDIKSTKETTTTCNNKTNNNNNNNTVDNKADIEMITDSDPEIHKRKRLDSINERWLYNISDMKITDNSNYDDSDTSSCYSTDNADDSEGLASASKEKSSSIYNDISNNNDQRSHDVGGDINNMSDDSYGLAALYLNEMEIDRSEEEQTITELVQASADGGVIAQSNSMRVAFGIILRLVLPLANGVVRGIKGIRDVHFLQVLRNIASSRQALTNLMAFAANSISMNLSSVQVSHRLEPLLKLMKIRKTGDGLESLPDTATLTTTPAATYSPFIREPKGSLPQFSSYKRKMSVQEQAAPKCCVLNILAGPPADEPIRADIVFIHGLRGSLVNTWKQGLWENERKPVEFQRPPKPPVRPPKRHRHSRSTVIRPPPHKKKRARFLQAEPLRESSERDTHDEFDEFFDAFENEKETSDFSYVCDQPKDIHICDGVEYSFPSFRLRVNDNGRLLQDEIQSILNEENDKDSNDPASKGKKRNMNKTAPKATANDPDYSKCWPGDWLPLDCPGVRVMALNYTTDQYLWRPLWKKKEPRSNLIQRSREMSELLINHRVGYGHPIIWVGHSKGGLFIKQIIVDAWESGRPAVEPFWRSSRGVFFYSVPHRGSHLASIKAPLLSRSVELLDIEKNSKYLLDLHRRFVGLYHLGHLKIEVFSFVETALTLMSVLYLRIVGVDSADPGIGDVCGIRLDHREICKPRSRECILYKELAKMINKVC